jgi:hypothetical protein
MSGVGGGTAHNIHKIHLSRTNDSSTICTTGKVIVRRRQDSGKLLPVELTLG